MWCGWRKFAYWNLTKPSTTALRTKSTCTRCCCRRNGTEQIRSIHSNPTHTCSSRTQWHCAVSDALFCVFFLGPTETETFAMTIDRFTFSNLVNSGFRAQHLRHNKTTFCDFDQRGDFTTRDEDGISRQHSRQRDSESERKVSILVYVRACVWRVLVLSPRVQQHSNKPTH